MWDGFLGEIPTMNHRIDLKEDGQRHSYPPYCAGLKKEELEGVEIQRQLAVGVIEPASIPWGARIVFASRINGTLRIFVDYRGLNAYTIRDTYPLSRMEECND